MLSYFISKAPKLKILGLKELEELGMWYQSNQNEINQIFNLKKY